MFHTNSGTFSVGDYVWVRPDSEDYLVFDTPRATLCIISYFDKNVVKVFKCYTGTDKTINKKMLLQVEPHTKTQLDNFEVFRIFKRRVIAHSDEKRSAINNPKYLNFDYFTQLVLLLINYFKHKL